MHDNGPSSPSAVKLRHRQAPAPSRFSGVPNSAVSRYHQVANARIERNSIIEAARVTFGAGADAERSAPPIDSWFERNLIANADGKDIVRFEGAVTGMALAGNVKQAVKLERAANGLLYLVADDGITKVIKPGPKLEVVAENELGEYSYASPALSQGQLFIRGEQNLYCIGK